MGLLHKIDPKIKKFMKKILYVKSGATVVVCIQVCICYDQHWRNITTHQISWASKSLDTLHFMIRLYFQIPTVSKVIITISLV
jgi:hypothetical protein